MINKWHHAYLNSFIPMSFVSPEGYFETINPAFTELTGYNSHEVITLHVNDIIHPEDIGKVTESIKGVSKVDNHLEVRYLHKLGTWSWARVRISKMGLSALSYFVQLQDLNELKQTEKLL